MDLRRDQLVRYNLRAQDVNDAVTTGLADRLAESGGLGRGLHRGGLRHLRPRDSLTLKHTLQTRLWLQVAVSSCAALLLLVYCSYPVDFPISRIADYARRLATRK